MTLLIAMFSFVAQYVYYLLDVVYMCFLERKHTGKHARHTRHDACSEWRKDVWNVEHLMMAVVGSAILVCTSYWS